MASPIFFPISRAKAGEIDAIGRLAPRTKMLTRPMLDFPRQREKDSRPLADYLGEKVQEITASWGTRDDIYLDFSRYEPETKLPDGRHIVDYVFGISHQSRLKAVPVVAPLSTRGPGTAYFEAVSSVAARDRRGMALRLPYEYFSADGELRRILDETLNLTSLIPNDIDVYLDAFSLSLVPTEARDDHALSETLRVAAATVNKLRYRRTIFCASGMPDSMTRHEKGEVLRVPRAEFRAWRRLATDPAFAFLGFGDYGVIDPAQVESQAAVIPPSRVRITTEDEYILYKGDRDGIRSVARLAVSEETLARRVDSWGGSAVRECAAGYGDPGGPAQWVARDTNMHIERTVAAMMRYLAPDRISSISAEAAPANPWLQESLGLN